MHNLHIKRPLESHQVSNYRGRFAPSPSGLLHFGSLIAALASFLDAKSSVNSQGEQGKWLLRIEDIDPPREQVGASSAILTTLEAFGLHWDEDVLYQSTQSPYYREIIANLAQEELSYYCQCSRASIKAMGGIYQGNCRTSKHSAKDSALRLVNQHGLHHFTDLFQGAVLCDDALAHEDFIIHRKDNLFAYQLAVVADDIAQNISHVIRGCDLLEPTTRQLTLYHTLAHTLNHKLKNPLNQEILKVTTPQFGHVPLAVTSEGNKLSKQNKASALDNNNPQPTLIAALTFLGQAPDKNLTDASVDEIIQWAIQHWNRQQVPQKTEVNIYDY